ncbi:hypothetical protein QBC38DRAFT_452812 [Podospora fimiseda]|uniref:DUF7580 domain-containing protein n=1 Tax=Podospora fimiseda TaxID=252190 RepID=A0AAN7BUP2_9PEZI|nr:hypothetical protein QBC38DRAFT_452812 [Podospora fimiseda]
MEVPRVVAGAIPAVIFALENYKQCLVPADTVKYEATLETFRMQMYLQKRQVEVTLNNVGIKISHGLLPSKSELERHCKSFPRQANAEFNNIILQMEILLSSLLDRLDMDPEGNPRWSDEPLELVWHWDWRRVKRGLRAPYRDALVKQLQYWNTSLSRVFEKPEIPLDEDGSVVQSPCSRFDPAALGVMQDACILHNTLVGAWQCTCPEHRANLIAPCHFGETGPEFFTLDLCAYDGTWTAVSIHSMEEEEHPAPSQIRPLPTTEPDPEEPKKKKQISFGSFSSHSEEPASAPTPFTFTAQPPWSLEPPNSEMICRVTSLCRYITTARGLNTTGRPPPTGILKLDSNPAKKLILACLQEEDKTGDRKFFRLRDVLASRHPELGPLSRQQRFSLASAATWAVLYLCGTPWLNKDCSLSSFSETIQLAIFPNSHQTRHRPSLGISYSFKSSSTQTQTVDGRTDLQPAKVHNQLLFALGVLLIELCLNKSLSLESLGQHELEGKGKEKATESEAAAGMLDDFQLAVRELDQVYLDAGHSYGHAIQRCLGCEFPGRDSTNLFDSGEFRRSFFNGVVAPVQATYLLNVDE